MNKTRITKAVRRIESWVRKFQDLFYTESFAPKKGIICTMFKPLLRLSYRFNHALNAWNQKRLSKLVGIHVSIDRVFPHVQTRNSYPEQHAVRGIL